MEDYSFIIFIVSIGIIAFNIFIIVKFLQIANDLRDMKEVTKKLFWKHSDNQGDILEILKELKLLLEQNKVK